MKTDLTIWADAAAPSSVRLVWSPEQAEEEDVEITPAVRRMWHGIIILSPAHMSCSHPSKYQRMGEEDCCCSLQTTLSNARIKQAEKTHLWAAALGSNPISQACVLQTGKWSTSEMKLLEEIKTLGKQVMTVDELLVCLFLMIMSSDQS